MDAFGLLCRTEGIIPAIESAHAVAGALKLGADLGPGSVIIGEASSGGSTASSCVADAAAHHANLPDNAKKLAAAAREVYADMGEGAAPE